MNKDSYRLAYEGGYELGSLREPLLAANLIEDYLKKEESR